MTQHDQASAEIKSGHPHASAEGSSSRLLFVDRGIPLELTWNGEADLLCDPFWLAAALAGPHPQAGSLSEMCRHAAADGRNRGSARKTSRRCPSRSRVTPDSSAHATGVALNAGDGRRFCVLLRRRWRCSRPLSHGVGILQVRLNRGEDHTRLDCYQVDPDDRNAHPRIDHNPLIEHSVENVDEARSSGRMLNRHARSMRERWRDVIGNNGRGTDLVSNNNLRLENALQGVSLKGRACRDAGL